MVVDFVFQTIRKQALDSAALNSIIGGRLYPQRTDFESDSNTYPYITYSLVGGFPDQDSYEADILLLEVMYVSDKSVDQCYKMYNLFNSTINKQGFKEAGSNRFFSVKQDSIPIDASGVFGGNILYIISNLYEIRTIG